MIIFSVQGYETISLETEPEDRAAEDCKNRRDLMDSQPKIAEESGDT